MEYRKISELKKLDNNPRTIKKRDMDILIQSIKDNPDYFEARPLVLSDRTGELVIIGGNQRYEAAKAAGLKKVPTHLIPNLTEEREHEIIIRDNVNNGEWNWDELANWGDELTAWGINLPLYEEQDDLTINREGSLASSLNNEDLRDSMSVVLTFDKAGFVEFMTYANYFKSSYGLDTVTEAIVEAVKEQYENSIR